MTVIDNKLMAAIRAIGMCEHCKRACAPDCHHIIARGQGNRLDVAGNLIALCRGFTHRGFISCHDDAGAGRITQATLWALVAQRERVLLSADEMETRLRRMLRAPKEAALCDRCEGLGLIRTLGHVCRKCDGGGVLLAGVVWVEQRRVATWEPKEIA